MHIGEIIHKLRKDRKMTLLELSQKSDVAIATLCRIEKGHMTGTLQSHMKICKALEIPLPELYKDLMPKPVEVRTKKTHGEVFVHSKNASSEILISNVNKKMAPISIRVNKGGSTDEEITKPGVEKFIYVLAGRVDIVIGGETYDLTKNDVLYFDSSAPHHYKNTGTGEARLICVVCPPIL